jgi:hypothetical protein
MEESLGNIQQKHIGGAYEHIAANLHRQGNAIPDIAGNRDFAGWVRDQETLILTNAALSSAGELAQHTDNGKSTIDKIFAAPQVSVGTKEALALLLDKQGGYSPEKIARLTDVAAKYGRLDIAELALSLGKLEDQQAKTRLLDAFSNPHDKQGLRDLLEHGHKTTATLTEANVPLFAHVPLLNKVANKSEITRLAESGGDDSALYKNDSAYRNRLDQAWAASGSPADAALWRAKYLREEPFTAGMVDYGKEHARKPGDQSYLLEAEDTITPAVRDYFKNNPSEVDRLRHDLHSVYTADQTTQIMNVLQQKMDAPPVSDRESAMQFMEAGRRPLEETLQNPTRVGDMTLAVLRMTRDERDRLSGGPNGQPDHAYTQKLKEVAARGVQFPTSIEDGHVEASGYDQRRAAVESKFVSRYLDKVASNKQLDPLDVVYMAAANPGKAIDSVRAIEQALKDPQLRQSINNPVSKEDYELKDAFKLALEGAVITRQHGTWETVGRLESLLKFGGGVPETMLKPYAEVLQTGRMPLEQKMWFAPGTLDKVELLQRDATPSELFVLANPRPSNQPMAEWRDAVLGSQVGLLSNPEQRRFLESCAAATAANQDQAEKIKGQSGNILTLPDVIYARHLDGKGFTPGRETDAFLRDVDSIPKKAMRLLSADYFAKYGRDMYQDVMDMLTPEQKLAFEKSFSEIKLDPRQRFLEASRLQVDTKSPSALDWIISKFEGTKEGARAALQQAVPLLMEQQEALKDQPPDVKAEYRKRMEEALDEALKQYQRADADYAASQRVLSAVWDVGTAFLFSEAFALKFFNMSSPAYLLNLKTWGLKSYVAMTMPMDMYIMGANYGPQELAMGAIGNTLAMMKPHWAVPLVKKYAPNAILGPTILGSSAAGVTGYAQHKFLQYRSTPRLSQPDDIAAAAMGIGFDVPDEDTRQSRALAASLAYELRRNRR